MEAKYKSKLMRIITYNRFNQRAGYIECTWINGTNIVTGNHIKYPKNSNRQKSPKKKSNRLNRHSS